MLYRGNCGVELVTFRREDVLSANPNPLPLPVFRSVGYLYSTGRLNFAGIVTKQNMVLRIYKDKIMIRLHMICDIANTFCGGENAFAISQIMCNPTTGRGIAHDL
eukprot:scaffold3419_cov142-Amphora_coffeaeformis.AAC.2